MGYDIAQVVISTYDYEPVHWEFLREEIGEEAIREWMEDNPFPEGKTYTEEEFMLNVQRATGSIILRQDETDDFKGWLTDLLDELS